MTSKFYSFALIFVWLAPWASIQLFTRIPGDAAFLYSGMEMLMQGKKMSEYFYDNNPPMSFLIYAPAAILHQITGISKHFAVQAYVMGFTLISLFLSYYFLQQYKTLKNISIFTILSCYLGAVTLLSYMEYGQKDHLIAIALAPLILMQLSITNRHNTQLYILWLSILLYAPFILLKPHFGILPVALILHRIYIAKKIRINVDFLGLAIATIAYITFTTIFMPDYIDEILPASLLHYLGSPVVPITKTAIALIMLGAILIFLTKSNDDKSDAKKLCEVFAWLATLSILPFWVQAKGFSLHLLPTISLMSISAGLLLHLYIKRPYISALMILALFYTYFTLTPHAPTMAEYKNSQLAKLLKKKAGSQAFFMETYTTNIISSQALYSPNAIASRFPSLWFLINFNNLSEGEQKLIWDKYGKMIAQDIKRHSPKLIGLIKAKTKDEGFLALFKNHKEFQEQFKNYEYDSEFILENGGFNEDNPEKGITYNIYLRK